MKVLGKATYIATQYFYNYIKNPTKELRNVLLGLLKKDGIIPYAELSIEDNKDQSAIITTAMSDKTDTVRIVTLTNTDYDYITDTLILPDGEYQLSEEKPTFILNKENGKVKLQFTLTSLESLAVYKK